MQRGGALNKIPMHQSPAPGIRALCESSLSGPACGRRLGLRMRPRRAPPPPPPPPPPPAPPQKLGGGGGGLNTAGGGGKGNPLHFVFFFHPHIF